MKLFPFHFSSTASFAGVGTLPERFRKPFRKNAGKTAVWITLDGDADPGMNDFARRAIADAMKTNPDYIIFRSEYPPSADALTTVRHRGHHHGNRGPKTVTLCEEQGDQRGRAHPLSAGSLYMLPGTTIGDCAPIVQNSDGTPQIVGKRFSLAPRQVQEPRAEEPLSELLSSAMVTPEVLELTHGDSTIVIEGSNTRNGTPGTRFWGN